LLASIGLWAISLWQGPVQFISDAVAVIRQSCRPTTWRRSIRTEFMRQCYQIGAQALPFILVSGIFVGFGIVAQSLHWLKVFGSTALFGGFMSTVLVREIAPVLVGLIVIGRSGSTLLVELGTMKTEGQVHMLDAQGIDPLGDFFQVRWSASPHSIFSISSIAPSVQWVRKHIYCLR
jgi:phospholipid/cholesterol/gamma-HCH transport system permease protein